MPPTEVFARDGLDAPMSVVADAAGAGVASVYRLFQSKRELLAALVVARMDRSPAARPTASQRPATAGRRSPGCCATLVERQPPTTSSATRASRSSTIPTSIAATTRATEALGALLAAARAEGRLRADATTLDLRLLFAATRAARRVEPEQSGRGCSS